MSEEANGLTAYRCRVRMKEAVSLLPSFSDRKKT
jgi:hypothetical protein